MAAINHINNRRTHSIKNFSQTKKNEDKTISRQYTIIRKDIQKLKNDLVIGYESLKRWLIDLRKKIVHNEKLQ